MFITFYYSFTGFQLEGAALLISTLSNQLQALLFNHRTHLCITVSHNSAGMNRNSLSAVIIEFPSRKEGRNKQMNGGWTDSKTDMVRYQNNRDVGSFVTPLLALSRQMGVLFGFRLTLPPTYLNQF